MTIPFGPSHGSVTLNQDATFSYTPYAWFRGSDSFVYQADDGVTTSDATITITVAAPGVLVNDTPATSGPLSAILVSSPAHGSVALAADGSFSYTPTGGYTGADSFSYRAVGSDGSSNAASQLSTTYIYVNGGSDIMITGFYSDGTNLYVQYLVAGPISNAFSIGIYSSTDGSTIAPDQLPLDSADGITAQGVHTATIIPDFDDWQDDYYLVAKVDEHGEIDESNENNNTLSFAGGPFIVHERTSGNTILHVQGTDAAELIDVEPTLAAGPWPDVAHITGWYVDMPWKTSIAAPDPAASSALWYDVTGDGVVSQLDADAVDSYLSGQSGGWQNTANIWDVNGDGQELPTPSDALAIINDFNLHGEHLLIGHRGSGDFYLDVSGDLVVSALDADDVLDKLSGGSGVINPPDRNAVHDGGQAPRQQYDRRRQRQQQHLRRK